MCVGAGTTGPGSAGAARSSSRRSSASRTTARWTRVDETGAAWLGKRRANRTRRWHRSPGARLGSPVLAWITGPRLDHRVWLQSKPSTARSGTSPRSGSGSRSGTSPQHRPVRRLAWVGNASAGPAEGLTDERAGAAGHQRASSFDRSSGAGSGAPEFDRAFGAGSGAPAFDWSLGSQLASPRCGPDGFA